MDADNDIWSRALDVERTHGNLANAYVAGRIDASQQDADAYGVELWTEIGVRLRELHLIDPAYTRRA